MFGEKYKGKTRKVVKFTAYLLLVVLLGGFIGNNSVIHAQQAEISQLDTKTGREVIELIDRIEEIFQWKMRESDISQEKALFSGEQLDYAGSSALDWYAFSMGRIGFDDDYKAYVSSMKAKILEKYETAGGLDEQMATEWHRQILTLLSLGGDPANIQAQDSKTINLVADGVYECKQVESVGSQGINGYFWGLIALDSLRYQVPEGAKEKRESILVAIIDAQNDDGGFAFDGTQSDVDMTATALQALAPYYNLDYTVVKEDGTGVEVREVVEKALAYLSASQNNDGMIEGAYGAASESTSQTIIALSCMGINLKEDERFIKNGKTLMDALLQFRNEDGGFCHQITGEEDESNSLSGEQAACALTAYVRLLCRERSLYDMRPEMESSVREQIEALDSKLKDVRGNHLREAEIQSYYEQYMAIPARERCYVYHYHVLADAMEDTGFQNKIQNKMETKNIYMKECMEEYSDGNGTVTDFKDEEVQKEIDAINGEIQKHLYPFDDVDAEDEQLIKELLDRTHKLPETYREQILGYEDLQKAGKELCKDTSWIVVAVIMAGVVIVSVCLVVTLRKKMQM